MLFLMTRFILAELFKCWKLKSVSVVRNDFQCSDEMQWKLNAIVSMSLPKHFIENTKFKVSLNEAYMVFTLLKLK